MKSTGTARTVSRFARVPVALLLLLSLLLSVLRVLAPQPASAQTTSFQRYSTSDGLSNHAISALYQDSRGFLWVGTFDGLNRFDGRQFSVYPKGEAYLSDNRVNIGALIEWEGGLWIGTRNGLNRLDLTTGALASHLVVPPDGSAMRHGVINALAGSSDALWVGTLGGLYRVGLEGDITLETLGVDADSEARYIWALELDSRGLLWVSTPAGLLTFDPQNGQVEWVQQQIPFPIYVIQKDDQGMLWFGGREGSIAYLDAVQGELQMIRAGNGVNESDLTARVHSIYPRTGGGVWASHWNEGLCGYQVDGVVGCYRHETLSPGSLSDNQVTSVLEDAAGNLFVGTWNGLNRRKGYKPFVIHRPGAKAPAFDLHHERVNAITEDASGRLWFGLYGGGLDSVDPVTREVRHFGADPHPDSLSSNEIWGLTGARDGHIWIATGGGGLNRYDPVRNRFRRYLHDPEQKTSIPDNLLYSVLEDEHGGIWIGTVTSGLARWDPLLDQFQRFPYRGGDHQGPSNFSVWPLLLGVDGALWLGTVGGGVNTLDRATYQFSRQPASGQIPIPIQRLNVVALSEAPEGTIWASTTGSGAVRFDPRSDGTMSRTTHVTTQDSLPHMSVACTLAGRDGNIWMATGRGLAVYDPTAGGVVTTYTVEDGLPENAFLDGACYAARSGTLYFGTNKGLVSFDPLEMRPNPHPPAVQLVGVDLFGKAYTLPAEPEATSRIALKHFEDEITFHFAGLEFTTPEKNRFAYRLIPVDDDWVMTQTPIARYPNLAPGNYIFQAKAANGDGVWSTRTVHVDMSVRPMLIQRRWFQWLLLALLCVSIWQATRYRLRIKLRQEQLERRLETEREESRRDLVRTLHDDIGGDLSAAVLRLEHMARSEEMGEVQRRRLLDLWGDVRTIGEFFQDATWAMDPAKDSLRDVVDRLEQWVYRLFIDGTARFYRPAVLPEISLQARPRQQLYMIMKEATRNAQRHAGATQVEVSVAIEEHHVVFQVKDNGMGFDTHLTHEGRGIRHLQEHARALGADLQITSVLGQGTQVALRYKIT